MLAPIMLGGFHKVALLFCDHPRGTPQGKFSAEEAPVYRISGRVQVLKIVAYNKVPCTIPDPLQKRGAPAWVSAKGWKCKMWLFRMKG